MTAPKKIPLATVRAMIWDIVFAQGGWLVTACAFKMTPEALRRLCLSGSDAQTRQWLATLQSKFVIPSK